MGYSKAQLETNAVAFAAGLEGAINQTEQQQREASAFNQQQVEAQAIGNERAAFQGLVAHLGALSANVNTKLQEFGFNAVKNISNQLTAGAVSQFKADVKNATQHYQAAEDTWRNTTQETAKSAEKVWQFWSGSSDKLAGNYIRVQQAFEDVNSAQRVEARVARQLRFGQQYSRVSTDLSAAALGNTEAAAGQTSTATNDAGSAAQMVNTNTGLLARLQAVADGLETRAAGAERNVQTKLQASEALGR